jgi:sulfoxide reductase heme-binding subunit YedZ
VIVTSLFRHRLSRRVWKTVHWLSYASWPLAFAHSVGMGTDSSSAWFLGVAVTCAAAVAAAAAWRLTQAGQATPKYLGTPLAPVEERAA